MTAFFDYTSFWKVLRERDLGRWAAELEPRVHARLKNPAQGDFEAWLAALNELPDREPSRFDWSRSAPLFGIAGDYDISGDAALRAGLMKFHPWRKGPFDFFGIHIDTEWRSDLKWERVRPHINLKNKSVLDLGCGNGYYLWRMLGEGAGLVLGIDPSWLYCAQFQVFQKYARCASAAVLPLSLEDLPDLSGWDVVFSMGLLYHRRKPEEHLNQIYKFLNSGGCLVLETLVTPEGDLLIPQGRYAKMGNVWNIPSQKKAMEWIGQAGFRNVRCADESLTTAREQRKTEWMYFESLEDFLMPEDRSRTVEGYPAPRRAVFIAEKP